MKINLHLFDGEGTGESTNSAAAEQNKGEQIVYGKQTEPEYTSPESEVQTTSNTLEEKRKAYNELINGEYKDFYTEDTQRIINKRFKDTKTLQQQVDVSQPIMDMLMSKYNVTDPKELMGALEDDNAFWEEIADERGMTVEQFKEFNRLERENKAFQSMQAEKVKEQKVNEQAEAWYKESLAVKDHYPRFDLGKELQDENFVRMLKSGVPMEHAYKTMHFDELMADTRNVTEKAVVNNIRAKGARPSENGTTSQGSFTIKDDVSKLSKADRARIAELVAKGELISF